jgi:hypothetical protein
VRLPCIFRHDDETVSCEGRSSFLFRFLMFIFWREDIFFSQWAQAFRTRNGTETVLFLLTHTSLGQYALLDNTLVNRKIGGYDEMTIPSILSTDKQTDKNTV